MYCRIIKEALPVLPDSSAEFEAVVQKCMIWDQYGNIGKDFVFLKLKEEYCPDLDISFFRSLWLKEFCNYQVLMGGTLEVLQYLKGKYKLGVITNGDGPSQNAKLSAAGIRDYFEVIAVGGDYGVQKPDPSIYIHAADQLGLKCEEIAFIGDTFATDILGAIRAGMMPVWVCHEHKGISNYPVIRINDITEVKALFKGEGNL